MVRRDVARRRSIALGVVTAVAAGILALSAPSGADVTAVQGSAYGYQTNVSLFMGPSAVRGFGQVTCTAPNTPAGCAPETASSPSVTLPTTGGNVTQTDPNGAAGQYGPAVIFGGRWPDAAPSAPPSGPISTDCTGTTGPGGSVSCNAAVTLYNPPPAAAPGGVGPGPIVADQVRSMCSAMETNPATGAKSVSGSASFVNGVLETKYDATSQLPIVSEPIPTNPEPNYTRTGTIDHVGDSFSVVFNEQITNPDGSLTVNAVHMTLLGPTAVGDLIIGSVTCGISTVAVTTSTTSGNTSTTSGNTSTTGGNTSTTSGNTSTTSGNTSTTSGNTSTTSGNTSTTAATTSTTTAPTTSTVVTTPTTTTTPPIGGLGALFRQLLCPILRSLTGLPFVGPIIQQLLVSFGCTA